MQLGRVAMKHPSDLQTHRESDLVPEAMPDIIAPRLCDPEAVPV